MSKFRPRTFDDSVNISQEHPLRELAIFIFQGLFILVIAIALLGFTLEFFVTRISVESEQWFWEKTGMAERFIDKDDVLEAEQKYVEKIFNKIPDSIKPEGYNFSVYVTQEDSPNAFALPGGNIIVTKGLLDELETENALTFVLGHEMGHFKNRDHLRGMGFSLAATALLITLAGQDSGVLNAISGLTDIGNLAYSRDHEEEADIVGLDVLKATYGHAGGATEFFEKVIAMENKWVDKIPDILSTHPGSEDRIKALEELIEARNIDRKSTRPIKKFKSIEKPEQKDE